MRKHRSGAAIELRHQMIQVRSFNVRLSIALFLMQLGREFEQFIVEITLKPFPRARLSLQHAPRRQCTLEQARNSPGEALHAWFEIARERLPP